MAPYTEPASNSVETTAPGSGRGSDTGRWVPPQAATPPARNAIAAARLTCSTSNPGVSFARSHAQREPRRSDHRRLPPPRARRRGRHGRSVPSPTCGARDLCVQGIAVAARERPHGREARSEEHTSELQSPCNLVCRLLLEKKKYIFDPQYVGC